jgi:hypothetical protein
MATIGSLPRGMLYVGTSRCFRYPHYIILADTKEDAEKELRKYLKNLELGIDFLKYDAEGSSEWIVTKNNKYIIGYQKDIETIKSDLEFGCNEVEI